MLLFRCVCYCPAHCTVLVKSKQRHEWEDYLRGPSKYMVTLGISKRYYQTHFVTTTGNNYDARPSLCLEMFVIVKQQSKVNVNSALAGPFSVFVVFFLELMPTINILIIIGILNKKMKNVIVL